MSVFYSDVLRVEQMKRYLLVMIFLLISVSSAFPQNLDHRTLGPDVELPEELEQLSIHERYVASDTEPVGSIQTVIGHVVVLHADNGSAYIAAEGDPLFPKDVVFTLADSRCRIQFSTEDLVTMGEQTRVGIDQFHDSPDTGEKSSIISILRGKAMFYVFRLFRYRKVSSSVKTPTAVVGVRGTKFGTEIRRIEGLQAAASPIYLADASGMTLLSQATTSAPELETVVHCFEGTVEVFSPADGIRQSVSRGQSIEVTTLGARDIQRTPPEAARQFAIETEAPAPEDAEDRDQSGGEQGEADQDQSRAADEEISVTEDTEETETAKAGGPEDIAQTQTIRAVEEEIISQGETVGYLAAMLTLSEDEKKSFKHLYISNTRQDFYIGKSIRARDAIGGTDGEPLLLVGGGGVEFDSTDEDPGQPRLASVDVNESAGVDTMRGPFPVADTVIGENAFMEWGYWTQPDFMTSASGLKYLIDNRGYFIFGRTTTDAEMSDLAANSTTGTYSGGAHGTYWTETGGADMSGTFSADVDFGQKQVRNFGVSVAGGGHQVLINGVNGAFQGNSSQFSLDPNTTGSVWQIDGQEAMAAKKEAYGSIYGPGGEKIGGVWKLDAPSGQGEAHATGIFEGSR